MNEVLFKDFMKIVSDQVRFVAEHYLELVDSDGKEAAMRQVLSGVAQSEGLAQVAHAMHAEQMIDDVMVAACWDIASLFLDCMNNPDNTDAIHVLALAPIKSKRGEV